MTSFQGLDSYAARKPQRITSDNLLKASSLPRPHI